MYHVKANYKKMYVNNLICDLCKSTTCDQLHLMECSVLKKEIPELQQNKTVQYMDLFKNNEKIIPAIKLFSIICRKREELMFEMSNQQ